MGLCGRITVVLNVMKITQWNLSNKSLYCGHSLNFCKTEFRAISENACQFGCKIVRVNLFEEKLIQRISYDYLI